MGNMTDLIQKNSLDERVHGTSLEAVYIVGHFTIYTPLQLVGLPVGKSFLEMGVSIFSQDECVIGVNLNYLKALTADGLAIQTESWYLVQADDLGGQDDEVPKDLLPLFNWPELSIHNLI